MHTIPDAADDTTWTDVVKKQPRAARSATCTGTWAQLARKPRVPEPAPAARAKPAHSHSTFAQYELFVCPNGGCDQRYFARRERTAVRCHGCKTVVKPQEAGSRGGVAGFSACFCCAGCGWHWDEPGSSESTVSACPICRHGNARPAFIMPLDVASGPWCTVGAKCQLERSIDTEAAAFAKQYGDALLIDGLHDFHANHGDWTACDVSGFYRAVARRLGVDEESARRIVDGEQARYDRGCAAGVAAERRACDFCAVEHYAITMAPRRCDRFGGKFVHDDALACARCRHEGGAPIGCVTCEKIAAEHDVD